jgi:hypothetical protein
MTETELTLVSTIAAGVGAVAAAIATIVLAFLTARYVRLTSKLVEETRAARAPGVVVDIEFDEIIARLVVANRGASPAHNLKINVSERNLVWSQTPGEPKFSDLSPVKNGVSFLPPGRTLRYLVYALDVRATLANKESGVVEFSLTYQDDSGQTFNRQFSIDFGAFNDMSIEGGRWHSPHQVIADAIRRAADHVKPRFPMMRRMRACPVCFESIRAEARKCKHCLEPVEPLPPESPKEAAGAPE